MASGLPGWGLPTGQGGREDVWRTWGSQFPPLPHFCCVYPALPCCGLLPTPHLSLLAQPVSAPGPPLRALARPGGPEDGPVSQARAAAPRESAAALKAWLGRHRANPYPSKGEKLLLGLASGMSPAQVSTWFANARRRLKKEPRHGPADDAAPRPQQPQQPGPEAREAKLWRPAELDQGGAAPPL